MNFKTQFRRSAVLFIVTLLLTVSLVNLAFAQSSTSTVSGTVKDAQGSVVIGATVRLINDEKGFSRTLITTDAGVFTFTSIIPDTYRIEIEASNFKRYVQTNVTALIDKATEIDATLEAGSVNETVNVTTDTLESIVNTQDASLGNNFVAQQILDLPLQGRDVTNLLTLQPGVTEDGYVAGGRADQANITIDGIDANDQQLGTPLTPVLRVNPDSIEEFRVTTTNADATKGRSSGAQISLSTRSGTNEFRGALYEYNRSKLGQANDFFNNSAGLDRPKLVRNLFGGRIGGPIIKNRLFFFYNYEGLREARETSIVNTVPLPSLGQGSVRFFDANNNIVTLTANQINALTTNGQPTGTAVVNVNPIALAVLADAARRYPANDFSVGDGLNTAGYRFNARIPRAENGHTARLDWKVTSDEKHSVTLRGIFQHDHFTPENQTAAFPDNPIYTRKSRPFGLLAGHTWLISNNIVNSFRYGWTRQSFSDTGDATSDSITFRGVFSPLNFTYPFSRKTDLQNFTDDVSWIKGNHNIQFGGNIRIVRNRREDQTQLFNNAVVNRSYFGSSGAVLTNPILATTNPNTGSRYTIRDDFALSARDAVAAVLGRFSQYTVNTNFGLNGQPLAEGEPIVREFATEEYDVYAQDQWKIKPNLTLTAGLRYGLSRPVYERQGFQAKPSVTLEDYLQRRVAAAERGENFTDPIQIVLAGPKNKATGYYPLDKNNFQPRISLAWSPNFKNGFLKTLFGANSDSTFRGGFAITNDYFGQQLAVNFDANNTLGFASSTTVSPNSFNVTNRPGPLYTGANQRVRDLTFPAGTTIPTSISFPQSLPLDDQRRIEGSLDSNLVSPINYQWNFTYGRKIPAGLYVEASYIGRIARNLLATRDVMTTNNIRDPRSGQTWYEAANILENYRRNRTPINQIPNLPFFENLFPAGSIDSLLFGAGLSNTRAAYGFMATNDTPGCEPTGPLAGCYESGTDWTFLQDVLDNNSDELGSPKYFYNRQYGALSAYGTVASSDYHAGTLSIRQRFKGLNWDLNYTFSKSIDNASGLQSSGVYGQAFILNALRPEDNRAVSDFDIRHIVNFNSTYQLPIGKGRTFFNNLPGPLEAIFGGWQLTSVFRYNSGRPISGVSANFVDIAGWPTNWNSRSFVVRVRDIKSSPTDNGPGGVPNLFTDPTAAYQSFRSPAPGETGDRNAIRGPSYITLDMGLYKSFKLPWNENHRLQFRWETYNVANIQRFDGQTIADTTFGLDPFRGTPGPNFGNFTSIQGEPRVMQFALRYDF